MKRRSFLINTSLATTALFVPNFLKAFNNKGLEQSNGKILLIVQLSGGNDGLNTFVPFTNDNYFKQRPRLGIKPEKVLQLNSEQGLNEVMKGWKALFDNGSMAMLNAVGYPNPDRSHFRSMDIWHSASSSADYIQTGWIGRYLDNYCDGKPYKAIELDDSLSLSMKGDFVKGLAVKNPKRLYEMAHSEWLKPYSALASTHEEPVAYLYKTLVETTAGANYLHEHFNAYQSKTEFPNNEFGKDLKTIAGLIGSGCETSVYYVSLGSFDTHVGQESRQNKLLEQLSDGLKIFMDEMKLINRDKDVLTMVFSEFGRRVSQNASGGTDHGTANNIVLIGNGLQQKGILNAAPDLKNLDDNGDIKFQVDFRNIYATILNKWLQADDSKILQQNFELMHFV